jgi:hypothetical protein
MTLAIMGRLQEYPSLGWIFSSSSFLSFSLDFADDHYSHQKLEGLEEKRDN